MPLPVGLTNEGLNIPTLQELLQEVENEQQGSISASLIFEGDSVLGNINGIFLSKLHRAWEELQNTYNAMNPEDAVGVPLAKLSSLTGTLVEQPSKGTVTAKVELEDGTTLPIGSGASSSTDPTMQFVTTAEVTNSSGGTAFFEVEMETAEIGSRIYANTGNLTVIDTPEVGWLSVTNEADSILGRDEELDSALRLRREQELFTPGTGTEDALRSDLLQLDGVLSVAVFSNKKGYVVDGIPPAAVEVLIQTDGSPTSQELWDQILLSAPAGKRTHGAVQGTSVDKAGNTQPVAYTNPTVVDAHIEMTILVDFLEYNEAATKNALALWDANVPLGEDLNASDIIDVIMDQPGVKKVEVATVRTDKADPPVTVDLIIDPRELVNIDTANIDITANAF